MFSRIAVRGSADRCANGDRNRHICPYASPTNADGHTNFHPHAYPHPHP